MLTICQCVSYRICAHIEHISYYFLHIFLLEFMQYVFFVDSLPICVFLQLHGATATADFSRISNVI